MSQDQKLLEPARFFTNISLNMSYDDVLDALSNNPHFVFRGVPDVSLLDPIDRTVIEVQGAGFVYRGFFSFYQDKLFSISIVINQNLLDYFTLWNQLHKLYGHPDDINPMRSIWKNDLTHMSLEQQPVTLKYLDINIFNELIGKSNSEQSAIDKSRGRFLEEL